MAVKSRSRTDNPRDIHPLSVKGLRFLVELSRHESGCHSSRRWQLQQQGCKDGQENAGKARLEQVWAWVKLVVLTFWSVVVNAQVQAHT